MSAGATVRAALIERLRGDPAITINRIIDGEAATGTPPYAVVRDLNTIDWGTKDRAGREVRVGVTIRDAGEDGVRAVQLASAVERAGETLPRDLPGWRVASAAMLRSRLMNDAAGRWVAMVDFRFRVLAAD